MKRTRIHLAATFVLLGLGCRQELDGTSGDTEPSHGSAPVVEQSQGEEEPTAQEPAYQGKPLSHWRAEAKLEWNEDDLFAFDAKSPPQQSRDLAVRKKTRCLAAILALEHMGPSGAEALTELLHHKNKEARKSAIGALTRMGPEAMQAAPALTELLGDDDERIRWAAAEAVWAIEAKPEAVIPTLIDLLQRDIAWEIHYSVTHTFGDIGPPAIPALTKLLQDEEAFRCRDSFLHDSLLRDEQASDAADLKSTVASRAADSLAAMGPRAKSAVPILLDMFKSQDPMVVASAALALGEIGPDAKVAVPALTELLRHKNETCQQDVEVRLLQRVFAAKALGQIGLEAKTAIGDLLELQEDVGAEWPLVQSLVAEALERINTEEE